MKGSLAKKHLTVQLGQVALMPLRQQQNTSRFHNFLDSDSDSETQKFPSTSPLDFDADAIITDEKDFILSQDFFWFEFLLILHIILFRFEFLFDSC